MIWPTTIRLRVSVPPAQPGAWAAVSHAAAPHGPFAPVVSAVVLRLSLSVSAIRTIRIAVSSS